MWTNEQLSAINAPNTGLIVSAAAGSGKTAVLVERLCKQICENIPVQKIVVVTFTEDAASQLKNRLSEVIRRKIAQEPANEWLIRQQNMLGCAKISTISSFCFNIIRENINMLSITPNFRIIDSAEESVIMLKAANETISDFYTTNISDIKTLDNYFCKNFENKAIEFLLEFHKFLVSIPFWKKFLDKTAKHFENVKNDCDLIADEYCKYIKSSLDDFLKRYISLQNLCVEPFEIYYDYFEEIISKLKSFKNQATASNIFEVATKIREYKIRSIPSIKNLSPEHEDDKKLINSIKDSIKEDFKVFCNTALTKNEMTDDYNMHYELFDSLKRLYLAFYEKLESIKKEKKALTFSDGEQLALELLSDENAVDGKSEIARNLSEFYEIIACDEYQDVNNVQEMIFTLISKNRTNLFAVGDIKQSIYRFRQANPKIFLDTINSSSKYEGAKKEKMQSILLSKNFRSSQPTVDFVNLIFSRLMSKKCGDVEYDDSQKLICGAKFDESDRSTEIMLIDTEFEDRDKKSKLCESDAVALKIKEMIENKVLVTEQNGEKRSCRYSDFCILMRTKKRFSEFKNALEAIGVKTSAMTKDGYLSSREIMLLCDILRIIDNPTSDISIAACALSPVFSFNADELSAIRLCNRTIPLYSTFKYVSENNALDNATNEKCKKFIDLIEKLRLYSAGCSISELIQKIYITTDLISIMQLYSDGEKKSANLRLMLSYAQSYEKSSSNDLSGFLQYLDSVNQKSGDLSVAQTVSGSDDAVTITTIHASKGLEYPFVFICDNRRLFNKKDSQKNILLHKTLMVGAQYSDKITLKNYETYPYRKIKNELKKEALSESLRLLYVALTRAKERLFITFINNSTLKKKVETAAFNVNCNMIKESALNANSFEDWFIPVILSDKSGKKLRQLSKTPINTVTETQFSVSSVNPTDEFFKNADLNKTASANEKITQNILNAFSQNSISDIRLNAKLTVTELVKSYDIELKTPSFVETSVKGAEKGNAIHKFMQRCNFENVNIDSQIKALVNRGFLSNSEAEIIDTEKIKAFFNSDIFKRMKHSDFIKRELEFLVSVRDISRCSSLSDDVIPDKYIGSDTMIQGVIDCIFKENDKLILIDYKSDRASCNEILRRYEKQLRLYCACAETFLNLKVLYAYIWSFENKCAIPVNI